MKLSDLIGENVYSIYEGKYLGYILNIVLSEDYKKIKGFTIVNDEDEYDYYFSIKDIVNYNDNTIFVKNQSVLQSNLVSLNENSLIHKKAYYLDSQFIGEIKDLEINQNFEIIKIIFDKCSIILDKLFNVGVDLCLFYKQNKKPKLNKFAPTNSNLPNITVKMQQTPPNTITPKTPIKLSAYDPIGQIGKISTKTVFGKNNEIIIHKGDTVTMDTIKKAKQHNVYLSFK